MNLELFSRLRSRIAAIHPELKPVGWHLAELSCGMIPPNCLLPDQGADGLLVFSLFRSDGGGRRIHLVWTVKDDREIRVKSYRSESLGLSRHRLTLLCEAESVDILQFLAVLEVRIHRYGYEPFPSGLSNRAEVTEFLQELRC